MYMKLFKDKLKQAMTELGLNQAQVVGLTGKSKSSISQYLSGKQTPSVTVQQEIARALGLDEDYFYNEDPIVKLAKQGTAVAELRTRDVGRLMGMSPKTIESGLKQGVFPWGYAIQTSPKKHRYFINARKFAEIERIEIPQEMIGG